MSSKPPTRSCVFRAPTTRHPHCTTYDAVLGAQTSAAEIDQMLAKSRRRTKEEDDLIAQFPAIVKLIDHAATIYNAVFGEDNEKRWPDWGDEVTIRRDHPRRGWTTTRVGRFLSTRSFQFGRRHLFGMQSKPEFVTFKDDYETMHLAARRVLVAYDGRTGYVSKRVKKRWPDPESEERIFFKDLIRYKGVQF